MNIALQDALSRRAVKMYDEAWDSFHDFLFDMSLAMTLPISDHNIALYLTHLYNCNYQSSTIRSHLSTISYKHRLQGFPRSSDSFLLKQLLKGFKKHDRPRLALKPVDRKLLGRVLNNIQSSDDSSFVKTLFCTVFSALYHGALRSSEVSFSNECDHTLRSSDIIVNNNSIDLILHSYKHSQSSITIRIKPSQDGSCLKSWYAKYLESIRGTNKVSVYAFTLEDFSPITRNQLATRLKRCIKDLGLDSSRYNTHSFRIGKATDMYKDGYSDRQIAEAGRWKSNAFLNYIRPNHIVLK